MGGRLSGAFIESFSLAVTVLVSGGRVLAAVPAGDAGCVTVTAEGAVLAERGSVLGFEIGGSGVVLERVAIAEWVSGGMVEYHLAALAERAGNLSGAARTHKVREHASQTVEKPDQPELLAGIYTVSRVFDCQACLLINLSRPDPLSQKPAWWHSFPPYKAAEEQFDNVWCR